MALPAAPHSTAVLPIHSSLWAAQHNSSPCGAPSAWVLVVIAGFSCRLGNPPQVRLHCFLQYSPAHQPYLWPNPTFHTLIYSCPCTAHPSLMDNFPGSFHNEHSHTVLSSWPCHTPFFWALYQNNTPPSACVSPSQPVFSGQTSHPRVWPYSLFSPLTALLYSQRLGGDADSKTAWVQQI